MGCILALTRAPQVAEEARRSAVTAATAGYPVTYGVEYPAELSRWLIFVKWLLAIPHYIVLVFLIVGAVVCAIIAWFAILFTGRYPRGLFKYIVGVMRWTYRVTAYTLLLNTDKYPPFELA
jgi:hypothetical protein